ncbi:esterase-like activity of phytase family protein [Undibacterium sp. CY18W]|uniref:Esterase-like activity of phytase family protein n=1 Tax=Undibacterium hunanense TaxID=2762292 RepID=A0ABR6ZUJ7_9BURK|nr:esterase-like activity of phytase family protein [Undibacterium hunanense]
MLVLISACVSDSTVGKVANTEVNKTRENTVQHTVGSLRFIGEQRIPLKAIYADTVVGGLSGIDYDARTETWILESDDRSEYSPARFYTATLNYDQHAFTSVTLTGVHFFKQSNGKNYPDAKLFEKEGGEVADIESIRFDPLDDSIWYASEGSRKLGLNPFIRQAKRDGSYLSTLPTPAMLNVSPNEETGSRNNLSFEGLSFSPDGKYLWLGMETAIYQDGPVATVDKGAVSRITRFDRKGKVFEQYAYPLDPIQVAAAPGRFSDNGLSEVLAVNEHQLLVLERSGVQDATGVFKFYIRLYEMDIHGATDIKDIASLKKAKYVPVQKRLVLNLNEAGLPKIDNIEGIAWGHKLPNGHDTIVLVSDDNFDQTQVTQLLVFEVLPK